MALVDIELIKNHFDVLFPLWSHKSQTAANNHFITDWKEKLEDYSSRTH